MNSAFDIINNSLNQSALIKRGGFQKVGQLTNPAFFEELRQEAHHAYAHAKRYISQTEIPMPERGGQPARKLSSGDGGPVLAEFYHNQVILNQLCQITGLQLLPTGEQGSYSYYTQKGDYLSLHRDVLTCDVTLITTIEEKISPGSKGGALCVYPGRINDPIADIFKRPLEGAEVIRLGQGESLVLLGGLVPHWTLPVLENEWRISALLCYRCI